MYTKTIYVIIDSLAIIDIFITLWAVRRVNPVYGKALRHALVSAVIAITANILVALSFDPLSAEIAYVIYFISIDWIIFFLCGFCLLYTEHHSIVRKMTVPGIILMGLDSVSIAANFIFGHQFYIYRNIRPSGTVFYQTGFQPAYYSHLAIDYIAIIFALIFIIYRIVKSYSFYRMKYLIILSVLLLVIALNIVYMTLSLVLDASVVFYAVAGTLIYFCIDIFVPRSLMNVSIGRAVDDMNEGLILFDLSNNCIFANAFSHRHFPIGEKEWDLQCEPLSSVIRELEQDGEPFGTAPYVTQAPDGGSRYYNVRHNKLTDQKGRLIGSYFLIEDTTEEVLFLNEIQEAKSNADNANNAKSSFLASMSHEIRTPLNAVLGMNEMILRSTDDPQLHEYAEAIRLSGNSLLGLINDILDFSKLEANKMDIVLSEYNPHELLRDIYYYFAQTAQAKDLYIRITCDESMPAKLRGDENRIRQILSNIVSNAVKYTKAGGVSVEMHADRLDEHSATLSFSVRDTGIGIAKEDIEYLFDAFRRVNEKQTANIQGTGLGLAITKELVNLMGGEINVESKMGQGSCFTVHLPQEIADAAQIGPFEKQIENAGGSSYHEQFRAENVCILVVDDVPLNLKLIDALLKKTGIRVDKADGGAQAIEMCMSEKYDLILLDHRMPDPDGVAVFKEISVHGMNTDTPVIMLTANALAGAEDEYLEMGFAGYLSKPVRGDDLETMLLRHLDPEKIRITSVQE